MLGSPILDVAIGLSFVYLLLALICTTVNEVCASFLNRRSDYLEKGVERLVSGDQDLKKEILNHPLILSLSGGGGARPSYIPASKFSLALMDIITGEGPTDSDQALVEGLKQKGTPSFRKAATAVLADTSEPIPNQHKIEAWYQECMDRVSGDYKRRTAIWIWVLAVAVTLALNANTIRIAQMLWESPTLRAVAVESAKVRAQMERPEEMLPLVEYSDPDKPHEGKPVRVKKSGVTPEETAFLGRLTGWSGEWPEWQKQDRSWNFIFSHILGWLLTIVAVSLGAPFWFDTLNRFMNLRKAGAVPARREAGQKEGGK